MRLLPRRRHHDPDKDPGTTPDASAIAPPRGTEPPPAGTEPQPAHGPTASAAVAPRHDAGPGGIACPSCARLVVPAPARGRKCPHCRRPIVVRRTGGRTVYLTEAAVEVFEAERRREVDEAAWAAARTRWLRLAREVGAPEDRRRRIAARPVSADAVHRARALYLAASARAIRMAVRARDWDSAGRLGRDQAAVLHREAGSPAVPADEVREVHAEAMRAFLRALDGTGGHAEIVGGTCCAACRRDDGKVFLIAEELGGARLPHAGCPRGLCPCEWWVAIG